MGKFGMIISALQSSQKAMRRSSQCILYVDFAGAFATVVVMIAAAEALAPELRIAASALRVTGIALVPFVLLVWHTARRDEVHRGRVYGIVAFNLVWLIASISLLAMGRMTTTGEWIIALQAVPIVPLVLVELRMLWSPARG
jgi:hypothetical protein